MVSKRGEVSFCLEPPEYIRGLVSYAKQSPRFPRRRISSVGHRAVVSLPVDQREADCMPKPTKRTPATPQWVTMVMVMAMLKADDAKPKP